VDALCSTPSELSFGGYSHVLPANIAGNPSEQIRCVLTAVISARVLQVFKVAAATSIDVDNAFSYGLSTLVGLKKPLG